MVVQYVLPHDDPDLAAAWLWQAGATGVWLRPSDSGPAPSLEAVGVFAGDDADVPDGGRWEPVPDVDWATAWREGIEPVAAGPFDVVPTWLADEHPERPGRVRIVLDPGRAFGSGHHDTTWGCLEAIGERDLEGASVLDVGTGTGILAIAAARRGARRVVGVDVDPDAVEVAAANAAANGVRLDLARGSVDDLHETFDLVLANLLTHTLVELADPLVASVAPGGLLVTSGIGAPRAKRVATALADAGLTDVATRVRGDWAVVSGVARA